MITAKEFCEAVSPSLLNRIVNVSDSRCNRTNLPRISVTIMTDEDPTLWYEIICLQMRLIRNDLLVMGGFHAHQKVQEGIMTITVTYAETEEEKDLLNSNPYSREALEERLKKALDDSEEQGGIKS